MQVLTITQKPTEFESGEARVELKNGTITYVAVYADENFFYCYDERMNRINIQPTIEPTKQTERILEWISDYMSVEEDLEAAYSECDYDREDRLRRKLTKINQKIDRGMKRVSFEQHDAYLIDWTNMELSEYLEACE